MAKFCIFCGRPPTDKNKEHVIPKWLIKMTDHPNRVSRFGFSKTQIDSVKAREFPFESFTFPACEECNSKHSVLEVKAMNSMTLILENSAISAFEISELLDWFDKVRVGLWLGFQQLEKNILDIEPNFHIERRIGQYDRMLIVQKANEYKIRLNFFGVDTVSFGFTPSAFSLTVNDTYFTNVSSSFLFSRRLGFPYPTSMHLVPDRTEILCSMQKGRERINTPLIQRHIAEGGIKLYQPMFPQTLAEEKSEEYNSEYVRQHSLDFDKGVGSVFVQREGATSLQKLSNYDSINLNPVPSMSDEELAIRTVLNVCDWQDWLSINQVSLDMLPLEQRRFVRGRQSLARRVNAMFSNHHKKLLVARGYTK